MEPVHIVKAESIEVIENTGEAQSLIEVDVTESVDQLFTDFDDKKSRRGKRLQFSRIFFYSFFFLIFRKESLKI